jgi:hypothetical protein
VKAGCFRDGRHIVVRSSMYIVDAMVWQERLWSWFPVRLLKPLFFSFNATLLCEAKNFDMQDGYHGEVLSNWKFHVLQFWKHYARSPNLRRTLGKMLDEQGSRPALPRRRLKSNLGRASHASQITKMQDAPHLRRVSPWLHTGFPRSQMRDAL